MSRLFLLPGLVLLVLLSITAWLYLRVDRVETEAWQAKADAISWECRAHAVETKLERRKR